MRRAIRSAHVGWFIVPSLWVILWMNCSQLNAQGIITTVAGTDWVFRGNNGPAINAPLGGITGVAVDSTGNVYASDSSTNCIVVRIAPSGVLTIVAGNGTCGFAGDGGPATSARISPNGVAVDSAGNLFIVESDNHRIRKVDPSGMITTVAGNGGFGSFSGDGGPATSAGLNFPSGVTADGAGNLFIADSQNNRVRKVSPVGIITTVAGSGFLGAFSGDGGPATSASLAQPKGVAVDPAGNILIADQGNSRIRKVDTAGVVTTVAGGGSASLGDGGPATSARLSSPYGVAVDAANNLFIADRNNHRIRKISPAGVITTLAGTGSAAFSGDGGQASGARLNYPSGVAVDSAGNLLIADSLNLRVRRVNAAGLITTIAGNGAYRFSGDGDPATSASFFGPSGVATDSAGNLYIADRNNLRVRKVTLAGVVTTVAGNGSLDFSGDGGLATSAGMGPFGVAVDGAGNLLIVDGYNSRIRRVRSTGIITTVAGGGSSLDDGGPATSVRISPAGVAVDAAGNLFIADYNDGRIRKVGLNGLITTVAGGGSSLGDGGSATRASLNGPIGVTVDSAGNLFIADSSDNRIRKVNAAGIITTVAGNGSRGFSGDGGPATSASLYGPNGLAVDSAGNLFIADLLNHRIRRVTPAGIITTIAGNGSAGFSGDGGPSASASLNYPSGVAADGAGNLFIADRDNDRIRKVTPQAAGGIPVFTSAGVTNGASFATGATPGSIVTIFGTNLSRVTGLVTASALPLATNLQGTSVTVGGVAAPLFAVFNQGSEQINLQMPFEAAGQASVPVIVTSNELSSAPVTVPVLPAQPGVFAYGAGNGVVLHGADNGLISVANPAAKGEVVVIYATGLGPVSPAPKTGEASGSGALLSLTTTTPTVTIGGVSAAVQFSGLTPGLVALYQINVVVPATVASGNLDLIVSVMGQSSTAVKVSVR